ncbi:MAG: hypothetical protein II152_00625 [Succinivibrionaceae bacterium]|nr:hypothetical protein [Succinivibrionaceae bacterium]
MAAKDIPDTGIMPDCTEAFCTDRPAVDGICADEGKTHQLKLTRHQTYILNFCSVPRTAREIPEHIGIVSQSRARKRCIHQLIESGALEMTKPGAHCAPNQKYRTVLRKPQTAYGSGSESSPSA